MQVRGVTVTDVTSVVWRVLCLVAVCLFSSVVDGVVVEQRAPPPTATALARQTQLVLPWHHQEHCHRPSRMVCPSGGGR